MTCRDFEQAWNELIDAETSGGIARVEQVGDGRELALLEHAADCPACASVSAGYQALRRALREWGPPPAAPAGLTERVLAKIEAPRRVAWPIVGGTDRKHWRPHLLGLAATLAAVAITIPVLNRVFQDGFRPAGPPAVRHVTRVDPGHDAGGGSEAMVDTRALNHAVADATQATWDLARSASEPAARISRQMLDAATSSESEITVAQLAQGTGPEPFAATVSIPSLDSLTPDTAAAGAMLQQVGDRLATGVRPLSSTARQAFGFLLGPAAPEPEVPAKPPAQKGA